MSQVAEVQKSALPLRQVQDVKSLLVNANAKKVLSEVAASHMNPERMMRIVANAMRTTRNLDKCEPMSLLGALMTCASLGLEPNTVLGHAYLIPFENKRRKVFEVQLIVGYKGFTDLARRSGQVVSIHADVVYSDDEVFSHEYGSNQHLRHKPGPRKGKKLGAYCHIRLKDGEGHVFMSADEIIAVRDKSQGWQSAKRFGKTAESPWTVHEDRMWAKTAVRRLANSGEMPLSIEFLNALHVDDAPADYRAFAMDPTSGIEGIQIDGEDTGGGQEDEPDVIEGEVAPEAEEKPKREAKPAAPVEERAPEPKQETKTAAPKGPTLTAEQAKTVCDRILSDVMDGAPVDPTLTMFEAELKAIEAEFPAMHNSLMEELEAFKGETGGESDE